MRSHYCGQLDISHIDQEVILCGWVHRRRDHGGVVFLDLRDRAGVVQVVFDPDSSEYFNIAEQLRNEFVIKIVGKVRNRPEGTVNQDMPTGEIEVIGNHLDILNTAETPPFQLDEHMIVNEEIRLRYRYIDLRRPEMLDKLQFRSQVTHLIRNYLEQHQFLDIETPILTRATPEGARDYLVPSRTHIGRFFALPQSPQLFKQLLMMSGVDRYYQIAKCFRDEDLRADRQPEFTQVDIEASFVDEDQLMTIVEGIICQLFKQLLSVDLPSFPRLNYAQAMSKYGSDKPDLRIPLELVDVDDLFKQVEFKVFSQPANDEHSRVVALKLTGGGQMSRKDIDNYTSFVAIYGAKGLAYIKVNDRSQGVDGLQSPILKFIPDDVIAELLDRVAADTGDIIFFGADKEKVVNEAIGALRVKLGEDFNLIEKAWAPCWVVDFPMFESDDVGGWNALHHPFTAPSCSKEVLQQNPGSALSRAYDVVLNGVELGGGSIRIHTADMQQSVFNILGIDETEAAEKFDFLLTALKYGCPPHGGLALGLDRLVMLMAGAESIREVMAFPKTQSAGCVLTDAPGLVSQQHLLDLNIRLKPSANEPENTKN